MLELFQVTTFWNHEDTERAYKDIPGIYNQAFLSLQSSDLLVYVP